MLGLKIENVRAIANTEMTPSGARHRLCRMGHLGISVCRLVTRTPQVRRPPEMDAARHRVYNACKEAGVAFLEGGQHSGDNPVSGLMGV